MQPEHGDQEQRREVQKVVGEHREGALREPAAEERAKLQEPQGMRARGSAIRGEESTHGRSGEHTLSENTAGEFEVQAERASANEPMSAPAPAVLHRGQQLSADQTGRVQTRLR